MYVASASASRPLAKWSLIFSAFPAVFLPNLPLTSVKKASSAMSLSDMTLLPDAQADSFLKWVLEHATPFRVLYSSKKHFLQK